ncbi:hypothetical protein [Nocardioides zhouii]|uniref:Uncharacterized protein n=1 Tax=Nocardioides zhouii TaxID=1168729 RepID=A0A4Q2T7C5_9ACTN|nr:hypothetical protein [Nocardioides zhouii]RYC12639.1 hypothetical protein EUA94_08215 [Nocardioides zhouii]
MNATRTRTLLATPLLVVALAFLSACGGSDDGTGEDTGRDTSAPTSPDADSGSGGTLALTADGSAAAKCAMPSAETLATFDTAFAGTVTSLDGGTATLSVDQWYAGDEADTVTVESPSQDLQDLLMAVDFEAGKSYLVSATDTRVTLCGFTAEQSPELQALYDEAFAQ